MIVKVGAGGTSPGPDSFFSGQLICTPTPALPATVDIAMLPAVAHSSSPLSQEDCSELSQSHFTQEVMSLGPCSFPPFPCDSLQPTWLIREYKKTISLVSKYNWYSSISDTPESLQSGQGKTSSLAHLLLPLSCFPPLKPSANPCLWSASNLPNQDSWLLDTIFKSCCYSTDDLETFWYHVYSLVQYQSLGESTTKKEKKMLILSGIEFRKKNLLANLLKSFYLAF